LLDVVSHYDAHFNLNLSDANKIDLIEYLKGILCSREPAESLILIAVGGARSRNRAIGALSCFIVEAWTTAIFAAVLIF
jgi:hypothetical protein